MEKPVTLVTKSALADDTSYMTKKELFPSLPDISQTYYLLHSTTCLQDIHVNIPNFKYLAL